MRSLSKQRGVSGDSTGEVNSGQDRVQFINTNRENMGEGRSIDSFKT